MIGYVLTKNTGWGEQPLKVKTVRIFVSSSRDVGAEGEKASEIFAGLRMKFNGLLEVAPYFWGERYESRRPSTITDRTAVQIRCFCLSGLGTHWNAIANKFPPPDAMRHMFWENALGLSTSRLLSSSAAIEHEFNFARCFR